MGRRRDKPPSHKGSKKRFFSGWNLTNGGDWRRIPASVTVRRTACINQAGTDNMDAFLILDLRFLIADLEAQPLDKLGTGRDDPAWGMRRQAAKIAGRTAWDRLGPDKNFSPRTKQGKKRRSPSPRPSPHGEGAARCRVLSKPWIVGAFQSPQGCSRWAWVVGGYLLKWSLSGQRWDYAGGYAGISGRKTGRFPLNPGYSRVIPHNDFQNFLRTERQGAGALPPCLHPIQMWRLRRAQSGRAECAESGGGFTLRVRFYRCKSLISHLASHEKMDLHAQVIYDQFVAD